MRDYHGYRYLNADMFVSYCRDLKVDLDPFHNDLEFYEQEGVIFPVARITMPKEYILERNQFDSTTENLGKRMLNWEELEALLFGNSADLWHDFDRALQKGDTEFIVRPQFSDFHPWKSYRVEIEHSSGQKYLSKNVSHYYHYWQVHQVYELQKKYPIYSKFNWIFKKIKEDDSAKADWLFPGSPAPITDFYGRSRLFDVLSFYIHLYRHERKNTEYPSEEFSLKMQEHANAVLTYLNVKQEELFDFLLYLLDLERSYRSDEKYFLANEVKKDQTYLIGLITYASSKTFDDIQNYFRAKIPHGELKRIRHLNTPLLVQDKAKDDLRFLLKQYNNLFSNSQLNESNVTNLVDYIDKDQSAIILFSIYHLVELMNNAEPVWFTSIYMGLSGLFIGFESFLRELANQKGTPSKWDLYNYLNVLFSDEIWWSDFQKLQDSLKSKYNKDNAVIISELVKNNNLEYVTKTFLIVYFARNLVLHRYAFEPGFYDDLYSPIYRSICFSLFYTWSYITRNNLI